MPILDENYTMPKSGWKYLKLQEGDTKFRVLSKVITWFEYFDNENQVHRSETMFKETPNIKDTFGGKSWYQKQFWAMVVYNYNDEAVQVFSFTTKPIQEAMLSLFKDKDFGDFKNYDIKITKAGKGIDTNYQVKPLSIKPFEDKKVLEEVDWMNLEALYVNGDPFIKEVDEEFNPF